MDGAHGRIEVRQYCILQDIEVLAYLNPKRVWVGLAAIGMGTTECTSNSRPLREHRSYIPSGTPTAQAFAHAVRRVPCGCWSIANSVHWVLDVTFDEDRSWVPTGKAPQNVVVLGHIALKLFRHEQSTGSINTKRFRAALSDQYLLKIVRT